MLPRWVLIDLSSSSAATSVSSPPLPIRPSSIIAGQQARSSRPQSREPFRTAPPNRSSRLDFGYFVRTPAFARLNAIRERQLWDGIKIKVFPRDPHCSAATWRRLYTDRDSFSSPGSKLFPIPRESFSKKLHLFGGLGFLCHVALCSRAGRLATQKSHHRFPSP